MPIPPTAPPSSLNAHTLADGSWEATCGRCLRPSASVAAADASGAWLALQGIGWVWHVSEYGGAGYALCSSCANEPPPEVLKRGARKRK